MNSLILLGFLICNISFVAFADNSATSSLYNSKFAEAQNLKQPWNHYEQKFLEWIEEFNVKFESEDAKMQGLRNFAIADDLIETHNQDESKTYKLAHNEFSHIAWEEFRKSRGIGEPLLQRNGPLRKKPQNLRFYRTKLEDSIDWAEEGAVTEVKNQQQCGSCWSFSATGAIEGAYYLKNSELVSFSEQMLVDCDNEDMGCNGGLMDNAFDWIQQNGGLCSEDSYPYVAHGQNCRSWSCTPVEGSNPVGWVDVEQTQEALMEAVAQQPVAIAIEADQLAFQFYSSGVFSGNCGTNLDHGVLLVGYGTSDDGEDFWKVKNSWGDSWGDEGYIYLQRGKDQEGGQCGLLLSASYPELP